MKQMVTDPAVNKVLVVCDERYATKADGRAGGVGTETQIISKDVYDKVRQEKFITLVRERDGEGKEFLPIYLRNRKYIDFSKDDDFGESYDALLRVLFGRPELKKPQLGKPPAHLFVEGATDVKVAGKLERLKDAVKRERPYAHTALQEYLDLFADSLEDFRLAYDPKVPVPFDDQVVASISAFTPYRDSFVECLLFLAAYMNDPDAYDRVFAFLEAILPFRDRPEKMSSYYQVSFDNYRFILYELFLYLVAGLIKTRRYTAAVRFMNGEYHFTESLGGTRYRKERADVFNNPVASLDEQRNQRLKLNRYSVLADLIVERATHPKLGKADLMQADFLLFFRPYLLGESDGRGWYPRCIGYAPQIGTFEIFAKATSAHGFEAARQILKVKDLSDLDARIRAAFKTPQLARYLQSERFLYTSIEELLNLQGIAPTRLQSLTQATVILADVLAACRRPVDMPRTGSCSRRRSRRRVNAVQSLRESCAFVREVMTPKGSRFLLCRLSRSDPAFPKYPPQPVVRCDGYQVGGVDDRDAKRGGDG